MPNTSGEHDATRSNEGEMGASAARHHHGLTMLRSVMCAWVISIIGIHFLGNNMLNFSIYALISSTALGVCFFQVCV